MTDLFVDVEANGEDDVADGHAEHGDDQHHFPVQTRNDDQRDDWRDEKRYCDDDRRDVRIDRRRWQLKNTFFQFTSIIDNNFI